MLISLSLSICQFQYFVGLFTFVTSLLLLTKMAAPYTIMLANESPMAKRATAAKKIASVRAGITFIGSGKGVAFLGICFPRQQTEFPRVKDGIWVIMGFKKVLFLAVQSAFMFF